MEKNIIVVLVLSLTLVSCELKDFSPEEWAVEPVLTLSESGIVVTSASENYSINVMTNYREFTATSDQAWCVVQANQKDKAVKISIAANESAEQRHAIVTVGIQRGNKTLKKDFSVYQVGGTWDVLEGTDLRFRWSNDVSESQKAIIKRQLSQLVFVEGGSFIMGAQSTDASAPYYDSYASVENPPHQVTLSDFYIGKYEVTQEQWAAIMATSPSIFTGGNKPVENISWYDAQEYVTKLSSLTGLDLRLPTSAQWEYAARGGCYSMGYCYAGSDDVKTVAHFVPIGTSETSPLYSTSEVGQKQPNELGLYDMSGNVAEMCSDWFSTLSNEAQTDPVGPNSGTYKVQRGGHFDSSSASVGGRVYHVSTFSYTSKIIEGSPSYTGFRIVMKR